MNGFSFDDIDCESINVIFELVDLQSGSLEDLLGDEHFAGERDVHRRPPREGMTAGLECPGDVIERVFSAVKREQPRAAL